MLSAQCSVLSAQCSVLPGLPGLRGFAWVCVASPGGFRQMGISAKWASRRNGQPWACQNGHACGFAEELWGGPREGSFYPGGVCTLLGAIRLWEGSGPSPTLIARARPHRSSRTPSLEPNLLGAFSGRGIPLFGVPERLASLTRAGGVSLHPSKSRSPRRFGPRDKVGLERKGLARARPFPGPYAPEWLYTLPG